MDIALIAIRKSDIDALLAVLKSSPWLNKGSPLLLYFALEKGMPSSVIIQILLEHGAKPNESVIEEAIQSGFYKTVEAFSDARPALIWKNKFRVLIMAFSARLKDWNNQDAEDCFDHLYGLAYKWKAHITTAHEAMNELDKIKTATFLREWILNHRSKSVI